MATLGARQYFRDDSSFVFLTAADVNGALAGSPLPVANGGTGSATFIVGPSAFVPTDQSGAGLVFTGVSVQQYQLGNMVFMYGTLTYPVTGDGSVASISLPVAVPNHAYAEVACVMANGTGLPIAMQAAKNSSATRFRNASSGAVLHNSDLSASIMWFNLIYPAS
jgi:hypothetical protein